MKKKTTIPKVSSTILLALASSSSVATAGTISYTDRASFESTLISSHTVTYSGISNGVYTNAEIDSLLGPDVPIHRSTRIANRNQVFQGYYNATNVTFRMSFTNTLLGTSDGVQAAGFNYGQTAAQMNAFVTFGDDSTQNYVLASTPDPTPPPAFFGITSDLRIKSIHVSEPVDQAGITGHTMFTDNLTFGNVPEPSSAVLSMLAMTLLGLRRAR